MNQYCIVLYALLVTISTILIENCYSDQECCTIVAESKEAWTLGLFEVPLPENVTEDPANEHGILFDCERGDAEKEAYESRDYSLLCDPAKGLKRHIFETGWLDGNDFKSKKRGVCRLTDLTEEASMVQTWVDARKSDKTPARPSFWSSYAAAISQWMQTKYPADTPDQPGRTITNTHQTQSLSLPRISLQAKISMIDAKTGSYCIDADVVSVNTLCASSD